MTEDDFRTPEAACRYVLRHLFGYGDHLDSMDAEIVATTLAFRASELPENMLGPTHPPAPLDYDKLWEDIQAIDEGRAPQHTEERRAQMRMEAFLKATRSVPTPNLGAA